MQVYTTTVRLSIGKLKFGVRKLTIAEAFKRARAQHHVSQAEAAQAAHVSLTQYQNYEYGKHEPSVNTLIALADYYNVSLDYLVGRSD